MVGGRYPRPTSRWGDHAVRQSDLVAYAAHCRERAAFWQLQLNVGSASCPPQNRPPHTDRAPRSNKAVGWRGIVVTLPPVTGFAGAVDRGGVRAIPSFSPPRPATSPAQAGTSGLG